MDDDLNVQLREEFQKNLSHYRQVVQYMGGNVPIQVLCLPPRIENALIKAGFDRVYDLIGKDLRKIKGVGDSSIDILSARLDDFFVMQI